MGETILTLKDIIMERGSERVLDGVSLELHSGEALGIHGSNGAGKSTLIGIIAGTLKQTSGTRTAAEDLEGRVCYVPQDIALYPALTGKQNLQFWAEAYGLRGKQEKLRVDYLLKLMGLTEKANKRVETYSGGMKRKLNMAAGLVITPKLLLLDEPTVGADDASVDVMLETVRRMKSAGTAVVMISHIEEDLLGVCDRIATLSGGKLQ